MTRALNGVEVRCAIKASELRELCGHLVGAISQDGETKPPLVRCIFEQPQLQPDMSDTPPSPASSSDPRPGHLTVAQARNSADAGQWTSALIAYEQAEQAHAHWGNDPDFLNDWAVALFHNQRAHEGLVLLDKAINLQPHYGYRYAARGWMKQALKDLKGAIADYEKALELDPDDAITLNNLGLLEEQIGRMESAKERFRAADAMDQILEESSIAKAPIEPPVTAPANAPTPLSQPSSPWAEASRALFTSEGRKEFLDFIRNGFKLKD